ncbi:MAG: cold shock CspA family protein, partial [Halioglobus sp.]
MNRLTGLGRRSISLINQNGKIVSDLKLTGNRNIGVLSWFDKEKGFGVIKSIDLEEVFLHRNSYDGNPNALKIGDVISFESTSRGGKVSANNASLTKDKSDFSLVMQYCDRDYLISISEKVRGTSKRGRPYVETQTVEYRVILIAVKQIFVLLSIEEIYNLVIDYYDTELEGEHFIRYCVNISLVLRKLAVTPDDKAVTVDDIFGVRNYTESPYSLLISRLSKYYGANLNSEVLYEVWLNRKFKLIGKTEFEDYEIPNETIIDNFHRLNLESIKRILEFDGGQEVLNKYLEFLNSNLNCEDFHQLQVNLKHLNSILPLVDVEDLIETFSEQAFAVLDNRLIDIGQIEDNRSYSECLSLQREFNALLPTKKQQIDHKITNYILANHSVSYSKYLLLNGYDIRLSAEQIIESIKAEQITDLQLKQISAKLDDSSNVKIFKHLLNSRGFEKGIIVINQCLYPQSIYKYQKNEGDNPENDDLEIIKDIVEFIYNGVEEDELVHLFKESLVAKLPVSVFDKHLSECSSRIFERYLVDNIEDVSQRIDYLVTRVIHEDDCFEFLDIAQDILSEDEYLLFDDQFYSLASDELYFKTWTESFGHHFPTQEVLKRLDHKWESYQQVSSWLGLDKERKEKLQEILIDRVKTSGSIKGQVGFDMLQNTVRYLLTLKEGVSDILLDLGNPEVDILLWNLSVGIEPNLTQLKKRIIYFKSEDQVRTIKRLLKLKEEDKLKLELSDLKEIFTVDYDLFKIDRVFRPKKHLDVSTNVFIKLITDLEDSGKFMVFGELLNFVISEVLLNPSQRFKLGSYFDICDGRMLGDIKWDTNGKITRHPDTETPEIYKIEFEYDESILAEVRKIRGRRWNPDSKEWQVPASSEAELFQFAKENRFFCDFAGSNYANNVHLAVYSRDHRPIGIQFCEGVKANKEHSTYNKEFWWCAGEACFSNCQKDHKSEEWLNYTLRDACRILGITNYSDEEYNKFLHL